MKKLTFISLIAVAALMTVTIPSAHAGRYSSYDTPWTISCTGNVLGTLYLTSRVVLGISTAGCSSSGTNTSNSGIVHTSAPAPTNWTWSMPGCFNLHKGPISNKVGVPTSGNSPNEMGDEYEPAYYPGVADMGQAAVSEVRPGDQMSAIDLTMNRRRSYRIRGRVIDAGTRRFPATASISVTALSPNGASGIFEIRNIAPGSYLWARHCRKDHRILPKVRHWNRQYSWQ